MNSTGTRKNKHLWCVCDSAPEGHWVSTQGQPQVHPNALKDGYAVSSAKKKYTPEGKAAAEAKKGAKRKPAAAASSSSTGSTLAEADLRIAKANINDLHTQLAEVVSQRDELHLQLHKSMDLGNQELSKAARTANETANAHAKQLRTTKATTGEAIAKMKTMRQHAHGFAELMLPHAVREQAPDHFSCWASFSGLLDDDQIKEAFGKPKSKSASSAAVYNIDEFNSFAGPAAMNSPAPNVAYNLTVAKVKASERPADYEPLEPVEPAKVTYKGKGKAPANAKKRARDDDGDRDGEDDDDDDEEMDERRRVLGTGLRSPFRTSGGRSRPPPRFPDPLPAAAPVRARTERAERTSTSGCARTVLFVAKRTKFFMCKMTFSIFQEP